jgi:N-acetylglucosaminyldiphosphoundecaprenol N-acetyl-beta-D-mannosaminyltransferase
VLNTSDLNIADGAGLHLACWREKVCLKGRFPGIDLMRAILSYAERHKLSVFLVARQDGLSTWKATATAIHRQHPKLKISGTFAHAGARDFGKVYTQARGYDIIFCNFGAPEQEYFLEGLREQPGSIRLAMGVGGSFDYISGKIQRAPVCMRTLGFEWLWRLIRQPRRWRRIWNAVVVFSWKLF